MDTHPDAWALQTERLRAMTIDERVELIEAMHSDLEALAITGIRMHYPGLDGRDLRRELARRRYGDALADATYPR